MIVSVSVLTTPMAAALTSPVISAQFEFNKNINQCTSTQMKLLFFVQYTIECTLRSLFIKTVLLSVKQ